MKITLTVGVSGSGKSTWAMEQVRKSGGKTVQLNRDDIRFSLFGIERWDQYRFTTLREDEVTKVIDAAALTAVANNQNIIVSDTNLSEKVRQKWANFAEEHGYEFELHFMPCTWEELVARNLVRGNKALPEKVLKKQYNDFMFLFGGWRKYEPNTDLPKAVIFDVDGTLMDNTGRSPFDWSRVHEDVPKQHVKLLWDAMNAAGYVCLVVSGRDGVCRDATLASLNAAGINPFELFQRKEGDCRKDAIIKEEIFWEHIAPRFNVQLVIDDRKQVVEMWRRLGIETWQVDEGEF